MASYTLIAICMFWFMISSCFPQVKCTHGWTFPKYRAGLNYHLVLGPLFWECSHTGISSTCKASSLFLLCIFWFSLGWRNLICWCHIDMARTITYTTNNLHNSKGILWSVRLTSTVICVLHCRTLSIECHSSAFDNYPKGPVVVRAWP